MRLILVMLFCLTTSLQVLHAQNAGEKGWKKVVTRNIDWSEKEELVSGRVRDVSGTHVLTAMLTDALMQRKIKTFGATDYQFSNPLQHDDVTNMYGTSTDSVLVLDPITGEKLYESISTPFDHWNITRFKVLESWHCDPLTGKISIQLIGIIPMLKLYSDDGKTVGWKPLTLFRYNDIKPIFERHDQFHPSNSFMAQLWNTHFSEASNPEPVTPSK